MKNDKLKVAVFLTVGIVLLLMSMYLDRYNHQINIAKYAAFAFGMISIVLGLVRMRKIFG